MCVGTKVQCSKIQKNFMQKKAIKNLVKSMINGLHRLYNFANKSTTLCLTTKLVYESIMNYFQNSIIYIPMRCCPAAAIKYLYEIKK